MPTTPTFPGLYIEELPSNARTITAAPTSTTVIVGYTHPYKTKNFNKAVRLFSFTDYEREFGGLYSSGVTDNNVPHAVNQCFQNGGSDIYVVGLQPQTRDSSGGILGTGPIPQASLIVGGIRFTALELTDSIQMRVTVNNLQPGNVTGDITITYGNQSETFRGVRISPPTGDPDSIKNFIENRINAGPGKTGISSLVTVAPASGTNYGSSMTLADRLPVLATMPAGFATVFSAADFINLFQQDTTLDKVPLFNILLTPGVTDAGIWSAMLAFAERKRAFVILDPPAQAAADDKSAPLPLVADSIATLPQSINGALYFPYLNSLDPLTGSPIELPPSGFVAGVYARTDTNRGVWKAPAGLEATVQGTTGVVLRGQMTDQRQGTLNPIGINCLRTFPNVGTVVFGSRTQTTANPSFQQWRYVPVRRFALFLEQTLLANLKWAVFEPNDQPLWTALRITVENFMLSLFTQGAFQGSKPSQAFRVICDSTTTTQTDIDNGVVNILVAFAPLKPAEFIIIKIAQLAGQTQA